MVIDIIFGIFCVVSAVFWPWRLRKKFIQIEADRLAVCPTCEYPTNWIENTSLCPECGTRTQRIPLEPARRKFRWLPITMALCTSINAGVALVFVPYSFAPPLIAGRWVSYLEAIFIGAIVGFGYFLLLCRGRPHFSELVSYRVVSRKKDHVDPAMLTRRRHRADVEE